ncbi:MAG: Phenylalanine--tRNA ligase alpha subunit [candidate division WS2 bacterium]|uniref:Phenylalanine--tRNA ligase alpha subunit n=1 Tax=Psychracetigena formicireducens TaxID=2986056 RepID=A0A9E2BEW1_PSYF1|nr:Phenylalanine--tRNA ligase alpha subunit [Candidatus Psychracetigena formicireducens]MBT9144320.1 Phenylalanine--tRNA ligase alpha subunit [Candidatus Psychracetigena formicireducens]
MINIKEIKKQLEQANSLCELEALRINLLGRQGVLNSYLKDLKNLPLDERKKRGEELNLIKEELECIISKKIEAINRSLLLERLKKDSIDPYLPPFPINIGRMHILNRVINKIIHVLERLGYEAVEGPEVETEYYNFEALNMPLHHPARDMWDTFYLNNGKLLRTHTSPIQIRAMEANKLPIKIIASGRCFRRDNPDASHSPIFHQIEALYIDKGVSFAHLKGTLEYFARSMFGREQKVKFILSYFPFVEPGAEVAVKCVICKGRGCITCKQTGWLEILGAGMVHPEVLERQNIDYKIYSGFAFGMGAERIAMLMYGINHIRHFLDNDLRFLNQFKYNLED